MKTTKWNWPFLKPDPPAAGGTSRQVRRVEWAFLALAVYFAARTGARLLVSDTPELDEAEQLMQSQWLQWGYGPQPPLYTWVQTIFFMAFGRGILALALLKNLLLFGTCALVYAAGRELTGEPARGLAATAVMFFQPQFVWFSQNDLTHSVMATFFAAGTFLVVFRLMRERTTTGYLLLALTSAGGVLSKYSFLAMLGALLPGLVATGAGRRVLSDRRIVVSLGVFVLLLAPHLAWAWEHPAVALRKVSILQVQPSVGLVAGWLKGFVALLGAVTEYLAPTVAGCALALGRMPALSDLWPAANRTDRVGMAKAFFIITIGAMIVAVFAAQATFKARWIQQNALVIPLLVASAMQPSVTRGRLRRFAMVSGFLALAVFAVLSLRVVMAGVTGQPQRQNLPYQELAMHLRGEGLQPKAIIADSAPLGAGFGLVFAGSTVFVPNQIAPPRQAGPLLIVWEDTDKSDASQRVSGLANQLNVTDLPFANSQTVTAPYKYCPSRKLKLAYLYVERTEAVDRGAR